MNENNPEIFFKTSYKKIKKAYKEYTDSLLMSSDDEGLDAEPYYKDFDLDTVPESTGSFYELLDSENYVMNILGEPFYMLNELVEKGILPEKSDLFGLASFLSFNKHFTKRKSYSKLISKQEFFYKHLVNWHKDLIIVTEQVLINEFKDIISKSGFNNNDYWKSKTIFEKIINANGGIDKIYDLLSNPKYIFITNDYLDIFNKILPRGLFTIYYSDIIHFCFTRPFNIIKAIKNNSVYDFNIILQMLETPSNGTFNCNQKSLEHSRIRYYYNNPDDKHFFQIAILKNKFKNAVLVADLYASYKSTDIQSINEYKYQRFINEQNFIKDAIKDWEDTMNKLGIHEDEL